MDAHVEAQQADGEDGTIARRSCPHQQANCTRRGCRLPSERANEAQRHERGYIVERVTGIEPALSAWESDRSGPLTAMTWAPDSPLVTVEDPQAPGLMGRQWPSPGRSGYRPEPAPLALRRPSPSDRLRQVAGPGPARRRSKMAVATGAGPGTRWPGVRALTWNFRPYA
jgi:hypothetical protein